MCLMNSNQDPNSFIPAHVYVIPRPMLPAYVGHRDIRLVVLSTKPPLVEAESNFKMYGNVLIKLNPLIKPEEIDLMAPYHVKLIQYVIDAHVPNYDWRPRR